MKQVVLEFDDEEMELLEEQFKQIQDVAGMETIEDYIYYATMSHCKTMQAASKCLDNQVILKNLWLMKMFMLVL